MDDSALRRQFFAALNSIRNQQQRQDKKLDKLTDAVSDLKSTQVSVQNLEKSTEDLSELRKDITTIVATSKVDSRWRKSIGLVLASIVPILFTFADDLYQDVVDLRDRVQRLEKHSGIESRRETNVREDHQRESVGRETLAELFNSLRNP